MNQRNPIPGLPHLPGLSRLVHLPLHGGDRYFDHRVFFLPRHRINVISFPQLKRVFTRASSSSSSPPLSLTLSTNQQIRVRACALAVGLFRCFYLPTRPQGAFRDVKGAVQHLGTHAQSSAAEGNIKAAV